MSLWTHETEHLAVDALDNLWLKGGSAWIAKVSTCSCGQSPSGSSCEPCEESSREDPESERIGWIDGDPAWPQRLGPEPDWFETELASLVEEWAEDNRGEYLSQLRTDYYNSLGDFARYPWTPL